MNDGAWQSSRSGSHAGRGFRYQDAVAALLAVRAWYGQMPVRQIVPEGVEDVSLELETHWLHLQVKSRREHRGAFSLSELVPAFQQLARRLADDETARAGLVLERPLPGTEAGLERALAEGTSDELREAIRKAVEPLITLDAFLARTHVLVVPAPEEIAVELLADRLGLPPTSCVAHEAILRRELARLADENGAHTADAAAALTVGDIARLLEDVTEAVDASALEEAVREGIAETVDFATAIDDARFFGGVDVVAGHVVAGLPLPRVEVAVLVEDLLSRQVALAVGPSGAGKSTLIWLAAYHTRDRVRWYRVRRLREDDVPALVRLVKGLSPYGAQVGLVVDDLGREDRTGFDRLVEELRDHPSAYVLGACREEDLFLLRSGPRVAQVRPTLEPDLAEQIWQELQARGETAWQEWREPYALSEGLLLEYGHLLAEGTRLTEAITEQVQRRVREHRALELEVLALVATADAFGAEVEVGRLTTELAAEATDMKGALARLVDEHLVSQRDGLLGGLHELRSRHVVEALHRVPPPQLTDSVQRATQLIASSALQAFVTRLLLEQAVPDDVAIEAVATRLGYDRDPTALAAALHALRLVGFGRMAARWREVLRAEEVAPTHAGVMTHLVLHDGDETIFPAPIQRAVARLRRLDWIDLRGQLIDRCGPDVAAAVAVAPDVTTAARVLAALGEVERPLALDAVALTRLAGPDTALSDVRLLLEAAYAVAPSLAVAIVDMLGGSGPLLNRLERELPWVRNVRLGTDEEGRPTAEADYALVAPSAQQDPHEAVVELVRYLLALVPDAEVGVARALDVNGDIAGGEMPVATKEIERTNLPNRAKVAWNRARGRAVIAALAATTETEHQLAARDIVVRAERLVWRAAERWARGKQAISSLYQEAVELAEATNRLSPPPIAIESAGSLEEGGLPLAYPVTTLGTMIANNLFVRLFEGEAVEQLIPLLLKDIDALDQRQAWPMIEAPPLRELAALRRVLTDLHAVVAERDSNNGTAATALRSAGRSGLSVAARTARRMADVRFRKIEAALASALVDAGFEATIVRRPGEPDSAMWPNDELLVLIDVATIYDWLHVAETAVDACRPTIDQRGWLWIAPVREGRIVASRGIRVISGVFPDEEVVRTWPELPLPLLEERLGDMVSRGMSGLQETSGIIASMRESEMHEDEAAALEAAVEKTREALEQIVELESASGAPLLEEIRATMLELQERVKEEADAVARAEPVVRAIAASVQYGLNGEGDELWFGLLGAALACVEWDVDPERATERVSAALD